MSSTEASSGKTTDEVKAELQKAIDNLGRGIYDREKARKACEHMDRIREENRGLFGEQDIAVELIRQTRDQQ
jgi:hypothetical protein